MKIETYLTRSPKTGTYSFRMAVPLALREAIGKREIKKSLKTKNKREAFAKAVALHDEVAKLFAAIRPNASEEVSPRRLYERVVAWAGCQGFDPFQEPDHRRDAGEYLARDAASDDFKEKAERGTATALELLKLSALTGTLTPPMPTVTDMVTLYLHETNGAGRRDEVGRKAHEQMVRRHEAQLLRSLKRDKALKDITRVDARAFRDSLADLTITSGKALSPASVNKALRIVRAMFNHAIREWELALANPFARLKLEEPERPKELRRPFTDEELGRYLAAAEGMNAEACRCTMLMAFTGARTAEITGLECGDVMLECAIPHIAIRPNSTRPSLKSRAISKRVIPLVGGALGAARSAKDATGAGRDDSPLFPRYSGPRGEDALSALQNKLIHGKLGISDHRLVAYSTRHTLKDRLRNALVPPDLQDAILGHNRGQVSEGYGSGYWLPRLKEALELANGLSAPEA